MALRRIQSAFLIVILAVSAFAATASIAVRPAGAVDITSTTIYFNETGHHLSKEFLNAWQANGGLMTFGYPISEPFQQDGMTVQYFERARFELHSQHAGTPWVVQATLLGNWLTQGRRNEPAFQPLGSDITSNDPGRRFFSETGHTLSYGFKEYWDKNGGLYVFGYPISEEFTENGLTVQYFERARFEWHPEHRGTQFEVLLGRLGAQYGQERFIDPSPVPRLDVAIQAFPGLLDTNWSQAIRTQQGWPLGTVITTTALNIRSAPSLTAPIIDQTYGGHPVPIQGFVDGDTVDGVPVWYKVGESRYIAAVWVKPLLAPKPPQIFQGRWLDVNLSEFYAVAYEGDRPVNAVIFTAGRENRTPPGVYQIFNRVRSETMDSATVGIPKGHPEYYYLENVQFSQYFRDGGFAVHGNYWTHPANYGGFTSNGCIGMMNSDAEWHWNFLGIGSVVHIHY